MTDIPFFSAASGPTRTGVLLLLCWLSLACGGEPQCDMAARSGDTIEAEPATSYRLPKPIVDGSYSGVRRLAAYIIVPDGRSEERITATMRRAAREIATACKNPDALFVYGYRPQDDLRGRGAYTVGRALYAPGGEWPATDPDAAKQIVVTLRADAGRSGGPQPSTDDAAGDAAGR